MSDFSNNPAPTNCRVIDFSEAEVRGGIVTGTHFLIVKGEAPCFNMRVELMPLVYIKCPEYWGIEVVGCLSGVCLTATKPIEILLPLAGVTGSKGIEVIGASKKMKFQVPGGCPDVQTASDDFIPWPGITGEVVE